MSLDHESLWNKSRLFVGRAIESRGEEEHEEFFFWMSLALEILGKSHLAKIHPALIADARTSETLLAVCAGVPTKRMQSIAASEVFHRCQRTIDRFDKAAVEFCLSLANERNGYLHSGELPFAAARSDVWISKCWSVVEILVSSQSYTLEDLVGYSEADAVQRIIEDYHVLQAERIRRRIGMCRTRFSSLPPEALKARRARIFTLRIAGDDVRDVLPCPACGCASQLFGQILSRRDEGALDEDEPWIRSIRCKVAATGLECEACGLELNGDEELDVGGVSDTYELSTVEEEEEEEPYMDE